MFETHLNALLEQVSVSSLDHAPERVVAPLDGPGMVTLGQQHTSDSMSGKEGAERIIGPTTFLIAHNLASWSKDLEPMYHERFD